MSLRWVTFGDARPDQELYLCDQCWCLGRVILRFMGGTWIVQAEVVTGADSHRSYAILGRFDSTESAKMAVVCYAAEQRGAG